MAKKSKYEAIKAYFSKYKFTKEIIELDECTKIIDQKKFYESMVAVLDANTGNRTFLSYYNLLVKFYNHLKNKDHGKAKTKNAKN